MGRQTQAERQGRRRGIKGDRNRVVGLFEQQSATRFFSWRGIPVKAKRIIAQISFYVILNKKRRRGTYGGFKRNEDRGEPDGGICR